MTDLNKIRRAFNVIVDAITELKIILSDKEKIKIDKGLRSRFEREVEKIGEHISRTQIKNPLFKKFKDLRNKISHSNSFDHDTIINSVQIGIPELQGFSEQYINTHFSTNTALKSFEKFGMWGNCLDRVKLIDALFSILTEKENSNWTKFPSSKSIQYFSVTVEEMINHPDLLKLSRDNPTIASQITEDIANWVNETRRSIKANNPFEEETVFLNQTKAFTPQEFFGNYESIVEYLKKIYSNKEIDFGFFDKKLQRLDKRLDIERIIKGEIKEVSKGKVDLKDGVEKFLNSEEFREFEGALPFDKSNYSSYAEKKAKAILQEAQTLHINILRDWEKCLFEKSHMFELKAIDKARKEFSGSLYKKVFQFNTLKGLVSPFTNDLGRLWDLSQGNWKNYGFELLKMYSEFLERDSAIRELSAMLGRFRKDEKELEEVEFEKVMIKPNFMPRHAIKGEVVGVRESDDLSSLLPIEAATLGNTETKSIFLKKYAEKKLMTFDFKNQMLSSENNLKAKRLQIKKEGKGPIIICVDTSGSMQGIPEQVAKTICFALIKLALKDNRKCFLISFSTKIQFTELTELRNSLDKLIAFLGMSFNGGTDASPALDKAVEVLGTEDYKKADVLMISDFVMESLSKEVTKKIDKAKSNKTKFHSLTISESSNPSVIEQFEHNWSYNTKGDGQNSILIKQLRKVA